MPAEIHQPDPQPTVKDGPLATGALAPTLIMAAIAMLGGGLNWWQKVKSGQARPFNVIELLGELITSGFVGICAYWALTGFGVSDWLVAAGVGIAGHMGTRALFIAEKLIERFVEKHFGLKGRNKEGDAP
ncbi:MAG TPA: phage holin family protein [Burkholderiales bacterium]|nr:phage holin family protein [Burkholderiales bacterium]